MFWFYLKGMLWGIAGVVGYYFTLRYFFQTRVGLVMYITVYRLFHDPNEPLTAVAGGNPSLFGHVWFWLWSMIVFAACCLIYLRVKHASYL